MLSRRPKAGVSKHARTDPMRLVIFDVDGTLVDSQTLIYEATRRTFAAFGREPPERRFCLGGVGLSLGPAFRRLVGADGPWREMAEAYGEAFTAVRLDPAFADAEPLFPGAREIVQRLAADPGVLLGVATGKSRRGMARLFARTGWAPLFATVQTADDHPSKPDPAMVRAALAETGIAPHRAVLVGDTSFDMEMAREAGVEAIGVAWGNHDVAALRAAGASRILERFEDMLPLAEIAA
jgi:phosphoglycolate phosphatase